MTRSFAPEYLTSALKVACEAFYHPDIDRDGNAKIDGIILILSGLPAEHISEFMLKIYPLQESIVKLEKLVAAAADHPALQEKFRAKINEITEAISPQTGIEEPQHEAVNGVTLACPSHS